MKESIVLNEGNLNCNHNRVYYVDNAFDGQAWWCDEPTCKRHEIIYYSPGEKIRFPLNAFIRTPNPEYGEGKFYAYQSNNEGAVTAVLPKDKWVSYQTLDSKI